MRGFYPENASNETPSSEFSRPESFVWNPSLRFFGELEHRRRAGDISPLIAIPVDYGDRRCLARASTAGTEKQNRKNRRLTSRGSPILVKSTWVAGEARSKINAVMGLTPIRVRTFW